MRLPLYLCKGNAKNDSTRNHEPHCRTFLVPPIHRIVFSDKVACPSPPQVKTQHRGATRTRTACVFVGHPCRDRQLNRRYGYSTSLTAEISSTKLVVHRLHVPNKVGQRPAQKVRVPLLPVEMRTAPFRLAFWIGLTRSFTVGAELQLEA